MKIKLLLLLIPLLGFFFQRAKNEAPPVNAPQTQKIKINFEDSLQRYLQETTQLTKSIVHSKQVINLNSGYKKNISKKKKTLQKDIDTLIVAVAKKAEDKVAFVLKNLKIDSICTSQRGFVGTVIFGKKKCKKWEMKKYYVGMDSTKIYLK